MSQLCPLLPSCAEYAGGVNVKEVQQPSLAHRALGKTRLKPKPPRKAKSEFHFLKRPERSPTAANARGQKMFGGRKTKAGSGGGLTVRVCLRRREGAGSVSSCFSKLQGPGSPLQGRAPSLPAQPWRWPPGEEKANARARLVRRKRLTRRFGQQNRPSLSEASSDLARKVGEGGLAQRLRDPPLWGLPSLSLTLRSTAFAGGISE
ncbi:uncharacterized protein LOC129040675 isoform X2 [Pongo pygmaeus]|uniref:uncharacterized protein LOC129040675 isoform X2 n=1 Tax=Pongo pygmaeus TaxID=9600 RepID=UPI00300D0381